MKAWIKRDGRLQLADVPEPVPGTDDLLVRVRAISLNRGEIRTAARAAGGVIPGWDVAGIVAAAAKSGKGPKVGDRVAALLAGGGWAERASVPVAQAAIVPEEVDLDVAATLPVAALTVVRALDVAGALVGKRVLITGGSGGVGQFAIQLAAMAGANVCAVSSRSINAHQVFRTIDEATGSFDFILESVGGRSLARAIELVARRGTIVTIGNSSEEETTFNARTLYGKGGATIYGLLIFEEAESRRIGARDLEHLLEMIRTGKLHAPLEIRRDWTELPQVLEELDRRAYSGKAALRLPRG